MKRKASILLIVPFLLTLAACFSPATPRSNTSLSSLTPTTAPTVLPTALSIQSFDQRVLAKIDINFPDELVFTQGFVWVKTDNGHVIQVDPSTNTTANDIKVDTTSDPNHYCQGLGTDGETVWACSASGDENNKTIDVVRIDPQSQKVIDTFKVNKIFDQFDMPFLDRKIWVLSGTGDKLVGIDLSSNQMDPAIDLGSRCFQLAALDQTLIATCTLDNLVLQIDPQTKQVVRRTTVMSPRLVAARQNAIWIAQDDAVTRLDPKSLSPVAVFTSLPNVGSSGDLFATDEAVWVRQDSGFLYHFDPTSNQIVEQIKTEQPLSGGSIIATNDSVWTTASDDNVLIRLALK